MGEDMAMLSEWLSRLPGNASVTGDELQAFNWLLNASGLEWGHLPPQGVFFMVWLVATVVGFITNILFICIISYAALLTTYTSCYLYNLSVANLVFLSFQLIDIVLVRFYRDHYYHYFAVYVAIRHICVVVPNLSFLLTLLVVSAEHYVYIRHPRQRRGLTTPGNNCRTLAQIGLTWVAAAVADLPFLLIFAFDSLHAYRILNIVGCTILVSLSAVTLVIVSAVHGFLMHKLSQCRSRSRNSARGRIKQVYNMFATTTVFFYLCFIPFVVSIVVNMTVLFSTVGLWLDYISVTLLFLNCCANPALYQLYSTQYRQACKSLCHFTCSRGRQEEVTANGVEAVEGGVGVRSLERLNNQARRHYRHFPLAVRINQFNDTVL